MLGSASSSSLPLLRGAASTPGGGSLSVSRWKRSKRMVTLLSMRALLARAVCLRSDTFSAGHNDYVEQLRNGKPKEGTPG